MYNNRLTLVAGVIFVCLIKGVCHASSFADNSCIAVPLSYDFFLLLLGERQKVLNWLLSYNPLWLRIGLEVFHFRDADSLETVQ